MLTALAEKDQRYVIVRTYSAGVFAGTLTDQDASGKRLVLKNARRLWYWSGAASLSQLAAEGVKNPGACKFPAETPRHEVTEAIEIIDVTPAARESIASVAVWKN